MKKVLFVATVTKHINAFHIPYLELFKENGYEVHVASRGNEKIKYCDKHYELPFERFPLKKNNIKTYKELKKIINENNYEIIHCHTPVGGVLTRLAARKARKKGTRVIYTAHGFHFYKGAPLLNWLIYYPIEKICSRWTDTLITINTEDYEFAKKKFNIGKISLINGVGVDEKKFEFNMTKKEKEDLVKRIGLKNNDIVLIYPAELSNRKNQMMLLKVISKLKNDGYNQIKLLLPGKDSLKGKCQNMAKKLNIINNVIFLGFRDDIPKLMKISDIAVSTSNQEGLPVNLIEAMMSGLPIVATNCRGNRDLINNCVQCNDVEEMKERIIYVINKVNKSLIPYDKEKYKLKNVKREMEKIYFKI